MTPPDPNYEDDLFPNDLPLPDPLQWESMEEGILTKMDAIQKRKRKRRFIFWLFPLLLLGGLGIGWWSFSGDGVHSIEQPLSELNVDNQDYQSSNANGQEDSALASETNDTQQKNTLTTQPTKKTDPTTGNSTQAKTTNKTSTSKRRLSAKKTSKQVDPDIQVTEAPNLPPSPLNPSPSSPSTLHPSIFPKQTTAANQIDQLYYLLLLPPASLEAELKDQSTEEADIKADFKPFLRLQLAGGLNWFTGNYKGADDNFVMLRQESEYYDPGTQFSARLERGFAPGVFVGSGFDYKTYRTRLDTEAQSTINRLNSMVLLRFNEDPITGDSTNQEFVDTLLTVHQLRRVRHYNRYTSLEIPLYLGYEFNFGRFDLALTGGLSASISREMDGRIFDRDGDVVSLGEEDFVSYRTGVSLAATGGLRFGYQLTEKFSITLGGGYQRFISNWMGNNTNALNSRPAVWSTNLGAAWRF